VSGNEALDALGRKILDGAPVYLAHAVVNDSPDALHWIDGQGLYAVVTLVTDPYHGAKCKAAVGGALYGAWGGRFHAEPLARGEHVLLAMVEGTPDGHSVILSRVAVEASAPPANAVFRLVNERNLARVTFDVFADGESWYRGLTNGSLFTRLEGEGAYTVQLPDGGVIDATKDDAQGGWAIKLKTGAGATVLTTSKGVALRSPDGANYVEVTDAGIVLHGTVVKTEGMTLLNVKPGDVPAAQAALFGPTAATAAPSTSVMVGA
jgi:hypothetical protein